MGFIPWITDLQELLLYFDLPLVLLCTGKQYVITFLNFQKVGRLQWVHNLFLTASVNYNPLVLITKSDQTDALSIDGDEVHIPACQEPCDLRLPELEALMAEYNIVIALFFITDIEHNNVISIDVNSFVTDNQLFHSLFDITKHRDICISNI